MKDQSQKSFLVFALLVLTILPGAAETRTWTFVEDGQINSISFKKKGRIEAEFVRLDGTNVVLKIRDTAGPVPLAFLSDLDRAYVDQVIAERQAEAKAEKDRQQKGELVSENNYTVEMENVSDFRNCLVVFQHSPLPPPETVDKILRSELESAVAKDSSRNIVAMAFLGDDALDHPTQYSGAIHYVAASHRVLTDDEYRGVKITQEDRGSYRVITRDDNTPKGRWLSITLLFENAPTTQQGRDLAVAEAEKAARQGVDVTVFVKVGDQSVRSSWRPVPGIGFIDYNSRTKVIQDKDRIIKRLP